MRVGTVGFDGGALRVVDLSTRGFESLRAPSRVPLRAHASAWRVVGELQDERIDELSGVVASRRQPGVLWVHNDSGDGPRVFAIGQDGITRAEVQVDGASAFDWEDIALGPGAPGSAGGDWVYVADTGDNLHVRGQVSIYRFPEPDVAALRGSELRARAQKIDVRYGDGATHDVEAMLVDPVSGDVVLVSKEPSSEVARLFRVTQAQLATGRAVAELVGEVRTGEKVVAGDVRVDGGEIVLRTYKGAWRFDRQAGESLQAALARGGERFEVADKAEAIAYLPGGTSLVTIPEGRGARISRLDPAR
jgi:hypothetical protein